MNLNDEGDKLPNEFTSVEMITAYEIFPNSDYAGSLLLYPAFLQEYEEGKRTLTQAQREAYTTVGGTPHLDGEYTVFGEVVDGMEVVDKIQQVETGSADRPKTDVKILKMKVVK